MARGRAMKVPCAVPFCRGRFVGDDGDEGLCQRHWGLVAGPLRSTYEAAWAKASRTKVDDDPASLPVFDAVYTAWLALKDYAIRRSV